MAVISRVHRKKCCSLPGTLIALERANAVPRLRPVRLPVDLGMVSNAQREM